MKRVKACGERIDIVSIVNMEVQTDAAFPISQPTITEDLSLYDNKPKKIKITAIQYPLCLFCKKATYKPEEVLDSAGGIFHKSCLSCKHCKVSLKARQRVEEHDPSLASRRALTKGQYLVLKEGSLLGKSGDLYCEKHNLSLNDVIKGEDFSESLPHRVDYGLNPLPLNMASPNIGRIGKLPVSISTSRVADPVASLPGLVSPVVLVEIPIFVDQVVDRPFLADAGILNKSTTPDIVGMQNILSDNKTAVQTVKDGVIETDNDATANILTTELPPIETLIESQSNAPVNNNARKSTVYSDNHNKLPLCFCCGKVVYKREEVFDGGSFLIFHKSCLSCRQCKTSLQGRQRVDEEDPSLASRRALTKGQYLVLREGSLLGKSGDFYCEKHSIKHNDIVKGEDFSEYLPHRVDYGLKPRVDNGEPQNDIIKQNIHTLLVDLKPIPQKKIQKEIVKHNMQAALGDLNPICSRCRLPIEREQSMLMMGMQRYHGKCPSAEDSKLIIRTTKYFVKKASDRLIVLFSCDSTTKQPYTFLFDINKESLNEALKKLATEVCILKYEPDLNASMAKERKFFPPSQVEHCRFDVEFKTGTKEVYPFSFFNPKTPDFEARPVLTENDLTISKFITQNGVLTTMIMQLKYNETELLLAPVSIELIFELWPPELAQQMQHAHDPLKRLRDKKKENAEKAVLVERRKSLLALDKETVDEAGDIPSLGNQKMCLCTIA